MVKHPCSRKSTASVLLIALTFAVTALAGCLGTDANSKDEVPTAALSVDQQERWTGERVIFNASSSTDPNGQITRWHFDFGDGETFETASRERADNVTHAYRAGGVYNTTLTVTDDGTNQTGTMTATDVVIVTVHEDLRIPPRANYAVPQETGGFSNSTTSFPVNTGAIGYEANITVTSAIPAGTSTVTLRVLNAQGVMVETTEVSVDAGEQSTHMLTGTFESHGTFTLQIGVTSGGITTDGMMRVYYTAQPVERTAN